MDVPSKIPLDTEAGVISELFVEHAFEDVLSRSDDREQMAVVGAVAAALGLSGPSAGMAVMSSEGGAEPVVRVRFMLGDLSVSALLWNWPFRQGQSVRVVGKRWPDGTFSAISVLDEDERLIVSYPHVTAGSTSHWLRVFWISLAISVVWWGGRLFSQRSLFGTSNPIVSSKLFLAPALPEPQFLE
ncbi:putative type VI secretion system effector [Stenotrophomonas maltophilia group sp. Smal17]|uniref:putative type VI secretion system effector n=1 Tax=Stenotrophomonas maltophilia group sp. Smal17 TaxID=3377167 RepID=UPI00255698D0|nr:putative type VI secretion system effector [Stenotrophomonas maltophilia]